MDEKSMNEIAENARRMAAEKVKRSPSKPVASPPASKSEAKSVRTYAVAVGGRA